MVDVYEDTLDEEGGIDLDWPWALSRDQLEQALNDELSNAAILNDTTDASELAMKYFYGELPSMDQEAPGHKFRSRIVSTDFADAVYATMAEIMPTIGSESPVEFPPVGQEDEDQAEIETEAVNHVVMNVCDGYHAFNTAIQDGLVRNLPLIKVYWEEKACPVYDEIESMPADMVPQVFDITPEGDLIPRPDPEAPGQETALLAWDENPDGTFSATIRRTDIKRRPRVEAVPRDEFGINSDHSSTNYNDARFLVHHRARSVGDLVAEGYDRELLSMAPDYNGDTGSASRRNRTINYETGHESTRTVEFIEAYMLIDMDGDGIPERIKVAAAGFSGSVVLLDWHFVNDQPFVAGYLYSGFYDSQGEGLFRRLKDIQGAKTELIRQVLDFGERSLTQRVGVYPDHWDMDSVLDSVMGGVAIKTNPAATMDEITSPDLPRASETLLARLDAMRREKGASAIDTVAQAQQVAQDSAHGTERVMSAIEQINSMLARNLSESLIKGVYAKVHRLLRSHWEGPLMMKRGSGWVNTNPKQGWRAREDISIRTGLSTSERMRKAQAIAFTIQQQQALLGLGMDGILVSPAGIHEAQMDFLRMSGVSRPSQYWVDPTSEEGKLAAQQKAQGAQQGAQQQQQLAMAQLQVPLKMEEIKGSYGLQREQLKSLIDQQNKQAQMMNDMMKHLDSMRLELAKLNAEYDAQEVPDTTEELRNG